MTKRRIVIAEDEPLARLDLGQMLENLGHDIVGQAGNGQEAVE
jgi:two-component system, response regulator PdtaR